MPIKIRHVGLPLAALLLLLTLSGCRRYPEVSSPEALKYIAALRTACSTQSGPRLEKVARVVDQAASGGKVTPREAEAFRRIIDRARQGQWQDAEWECLAFQKAQLRGW